MKERLFRFKQFNVRHELSAMKVGVDAVLLGAWADISGVRSVLDVGTGCGVIALAVAQRTPQASFLGIDIDHPSVLEAEINFKSSPWSSRMATLECSFDDVEKLGKKFDLIISNPPYFDSGVNPTSNSRMRARHIGELSPSALINNTPRLLTESGILAMITPADAEEHLMNCAAANGMSLRRILRVKGTPKGSVKRILTEFCLDCPKSSPKEEFLTIQLSPEEYTDEYMALTKEFYLKF